MTVSPPVSPRFSRSLWKIEISPHVRAVCTTEGHRRSLDFAASYPFVLDSLRREPSRCPSRHAEGRLSAIAVEREHREGRGGMRCGGVSINSNMNIRGTDSSGLPTRAKIIALDRQFALWDESEPSARRGNPASAILEVEKELRPDLIVMATHGRTGLSHLVLGSVAECTVRESTVPVLTIRGQHGVA